MGHLTVQFAILPLGFASMVSEGSCVAPRLSSGHSEQRRPKWNGSLFFVFLEFELLDNNKCFNCTVQKTICKGVRALVPL